jgi:hypothetical protein
MPKDCALARFLFDVAGEQVLVSETALLSAQTKHAPFLWIIITPGDILASLCWTAMLLEHQVSYSPIQSFSGCTLC